MITRREFGKRISLGGLAALAFAALASPVSFLTGCKASDIFARILAYVGVGLQAFQSVVNILIASGVINPIEGSAIAAIINLVKVGFADLQTAINDYEAAPADQKATLLGRISTALNVLIARLGSFWENLTIPDSRLAALIAGLLGVIVSTLKAFAIQLPAPATAERLSARAASVSPVERDEKRFKKDFNRLLDEAGYGQYDLR